MTEDNRNNASRGHKSFWSTIPGLITAAAGFVTATATLLGALAAIGVFEPTEELSVTTVSAEETRIAELEEKLLAAQNARAKSTSVSPAIKAPEPKEPIATTRPLEGLTGTIRYTLDMDSEAQRVQKVLQKLGLTVTRDPILNTGKIKFVAGIYNRKIQYRTANHLELALLIERALSNEKMRFEAEFTGKDAFGFHEDDFHIHFDH